MPPKKGKAARPEPKSEERVIDSDEDDLPIGPDQIMAEADDDITSSRQLRRKRKPSKAKAPVTNNTEELWGKGIFACGEASLARCLTLKMIDLKIFAYVAEECLSVANFTVNPVRFHAIGGMATRHSILALAYRAKGIRSLAAVDENVHQLRSYSFYWSFRAVADFERPNTTDFLRPVTGAASRWRQRGPQSLVV